VERITNLFGTLGPLRLSLIGSVVIGIVAFFFVIFSKGSSPDQTLLFSDLDPRDAGAIIQKLESSGVPFEVKNNGSQIYAPKERVDRLRMELALEGIPSGGTVGFELFDKVDALTATGPMLDINYIRALEGSLSRSVQSIEGVVTARVHLVIPKKELFTRDSTPPTASIVLRLRGANRLGPPQVRAIQHLLASAVPGLTANRVSIIDDRGNLLARGQDDESVSEALSTQQEVKTSEQSRMARSVEAILEKTIGFGKVKAEVSLDLDFDRTTINSENYDPNGQVIRSTSVVEGDESQSDPAAQSVTTQNALPNQNIAGQAGNQANQAKRKEEVTNYEISKVIKNQVQEFGRVKKLSVAVLVDGTYKSDGKGKKTYIPRAKQELIQLTNLVKTTIGFDSSRGDKVEVTNMPFINDLNDSDLTDVAKKWYSDLNMNELIEMGVLAFVAILALLLVIRPIILKILETSQSANDDELLAGIEVSNVPLPGSAPSAPKEGSFDDQLDQMINMSSIEGGIRSSSIEKIAKVVDEKPDEVVTLLRGWMNEENRNG
jgi:flagellar M-ring protein FliF